MVLCWLWMTIVVSEHIVSRHCKMSGNFCGMWASPALAIESRPSDSIQLLSDCLCAQLEDKQSQPVKECCITISKVAQLIREGWNLQAHSAAYAAYNVTVKVISTSAHKGLSALIALVKTEIMVIELDKGYQEEHISMLFRCSQYLLQYSVTMKSELEIYTEALEVLLRGQSQSIWWMCGVWEKSAGFISCKNF